MRKPDELHFLFIYLTLEAVGVEISVECPQPGGCLLTIFGNDRLLAEGTFWGLFPINNKNRKTDFKINFR